MMSNPGPQSSYFQNLDLGIIAEPLVHRELVPVSAQLSLARQDVKERESSEDIADAFG
jgi:hypothetical protein